MTFSGNSTTAGSPGTRGSARSWPARCVRLNRSRVTSSDSPVGATSQSRATRLAPGRSLVTVSRTRALPRISTGAVSGCEVKLSERPSSPRWSPGQSPEPPSAVSAPASSPAVCSPRWLRRSPSPGLSASEPFPLGPQVQAPRPVAGVGRGPARLGHPAARPLPVVRRGRRVLLHPGPEHRLVHDPGVDPLEPVVPPPQRLLEEADLRPGHRVVRERVRPRPDQALARARQAGQQARDGVGVAVGPAADGVHRHLDRGVVLAHRTRGASTRRAAGAPSTAR